MSDWGATMGKWGAFFREKWDAKASRIRAGSLFMESTAAWSGFGYDGKREQTCEMDPVGVMSDGCSGTWAESPMRKFGRAWASGGSR